jgi:hypothetical protein
MDIHSLLDAVAIFCGDLEVTYINPIAQLAKNGNSHSIVLGAT